MSSQATLFNHPRVPDRGGRDANQGDSITVQRIYLDSAPRGNRSPSFESDGCVQKSYSSTRSSGEWRSVQHAWKLWPLQQATIKRPLRASRSSIQATSFDYHRVPSRSSRDASQDSLSSQCNSSITTLLLITTTVRHSRPKNAC